MIIYVVFVFEGLALLVLAAFATIIFSERDRFDEPRTALLRDPVGLQMDIAAKTAFWFWLVAAAVATVLTT
ncbi:hypothetical protein [Maritalea porphyrae]|jgi:hypothetical protein|uniref:hypothetical protein n=1 Tax=Maritalea porphyrae TaxID=880732 RepID=UPI0022B02E1E|nr:hypothetical protein [Maritalea porphyrae]MCZ4274057.1 hypothetical protein [Maritalea porphyrae]